MKIPDCKTCAKCCYLSHPILDVQVKKRDRIPEEFYEYRAGGPFKLMGHWMKRKENTACVCLDETTNKCSIYSKRPEMCRVFKEGCLDCVALVCGDDLNDTYRDEDYLKYNCGIKPGTTVEQFARMSDEYSIETLDDVKQYLRIHGKNAATNFKGKVYHWTPDLVKPN